jgi:hypothetical protein
MNISTEGSPEDLIQKCKDCEYCIFEHFLGENQRKIKVLGVPLPNNHVHRRTIEEICGRDHDEVCNMKYAAMRAFFDDFMPAQFGAVTTFKLDLGKKNKRETGYEETLREWSKKQDFGRGVSESYASRFREIWNKGLRKSKQILTTDNIYEIVIATPGTYELASRMLEELFKEHKQRDKNGVTNGQDYGQTG